MKLQNVKAIRSLGFEYQIEYVLDEEGMNGLDGKISVCYENIKIRKSISENRKSQTLWHEIIHHISDYSNIKDDGSDFTETEINRLATALHDLEIIQNK